MSLNYTPWDHYRDDKSNSAPVAEDLNGQIVGLELEIASVYDYDAFNNAIENGVLETEDSARANIQLEYEAQSNVEFECVFNADVPANIMARLRELNRYIAGEYSNHRETSAHVHINRAYIENVLDLDPIEYYMAAESIAPLIYKLSGRSIETWNRWTASNVSINENFINRFQLIDGIEPRTREDYGGDARYELCNMQNNKTIEIRGFSNYYEGNEELIGLYIDIVADLIPEIALNMQGKAYASDYEIVLKTVAAFLEEHPAAANHNESYINTWKNWKAEVITAKRAQYEQAISKYQETISYLNRARQQVGYDNNEAARYILSALRINRDLKLDSLNLLDPLRDINALEGQAQKLFKNIIWRL